MWIIASDMGNIAYIIFPILNCHCPCSILCSGGENMGIRDSLQRIISKKEQEIADLEQRIRDARIYLQAVQDSMKALPRDVMDSDKPRELRPGTAVAKARDLIRNAGRPLHITDILKGLGKPIDKKNKLSLSGSLAGYVREGQVFNRPAPNTFGLVELGGNGSRAELPEDFGKM
jgi:hypothetical protein